MFDTAASINHKLLESLSQVTMSNLRHTNATANITKGKIGTRDGKEQEGGEVGNAVLVCCRVGGQYHPNRRLWRAIDVNNSGLVSLAKVKHPEAEGGSLPRPRSPLPR